MALHANLAKTHMPLTLPIGLASKFNTTYYWPNILTHFRILKIFQNCLERKTKYYSKLREPCAPCGMQPRRGGPWTCENGLAWVHSFLSYSIPLTSNTSTQILISLVPYAFGIAKLFLHWLPASHFEKHFYSLSNTAW